VSAAHEFGGHALDGERRDARPLDEYWGGLVRPGKWDEIWCYQGPACSSVREGPGAVMSSEQALVQ
jgi:hypothetical protein